MHLMMILHQSVSTHFDFVDAKIGDLLDYRFGKRSKAACDYQPPFRVVASSINTLSANIRASQHL